VANEIVHRQPREGRLSICKGLRCALDQKRDVLFSNDLRNTGKLDAMGAETEELEALIKLLDARKRKAEALRALEEAR
jgi:hypothetical protein